MQGGELCSEEAESVLRQLLVKMPMPCRFVSQEMLDIEAQIEAYIAAHNLNPLSFEQALRLNLANTRRFCIDYDYFWLGKHL